MITSADVCTVATSLGFTPSQDEILTVISEHADASLQDLSASWELVVENQLYAMDVKKKIASLDTFRAAVKESYRQGHDLREVVGGLLEEGVDMVAILKAAGHENAVKAKGISLTDSGHLRDVIGGSYGKRFRISSGVHALGAIFPESEYQDLGLGEHDDDEICKIESALWGFDVFLEDPAERVDVESWILIEE